MVSKKVITILSDSPTIPTGYSNQSSQLALYLTKQGHTIHFLGNAYQGSTIERFKVEGVDEYNIKLYGMGTQPYFADKISQHLKDTKSDYFIILLDTFMLMDGQNRLPHGWFLNIDCSPAQTIFWFPSDGGGGMPLGCENILKKVEIPVAMAKYGQKQVKDYYNINTLHIPHGTNPNMYYKLPDNERFELRKKFNLHDKFVVGVVARNQPRKFLDRTIKTFRLMNKIKDKIPNVVLFLHLDPADPAQIFNIRNLIARYNLENRVMFSGMNAFKGFPRSEMNNVYNLMDVFFLSTSGEGFGIPIIEAMSAEVPVVATNYTTTHELVVENQSGFGVELVGSDKVQVLTPDGPLSMDSKEYDNLVSNGTITGSWEVERGLMDIDDAANKIIQLYENPNLRLQFGKNGRKSVLDKYDFEKVGEAFEKIINGK